MSSTRMRTSTSTKRKRKTKNEESGTTGGTDALRSPGAGHGYAGAWYGAGWEKSRRICPGELWPARGEWRGPERRWWRADQRHGISAQHEEQVDSQLYNCGGRTLPLRTGKYGGRLRSLGRKREQEKPLEDCQLMGFPQGSVGGAANQITET